MPPTELRPSAGPSALAERLLASPVSDDDTAEGDGMDAGRRAPRPAAKARTAYHVRLISPDRLVVLDWLARAARGFPVHGLVEFDVGSAKARIAASEPPVSWTGFVMATMGRAVALHPEVNERRAGRRLLLFDHVDLGATVERTIGGTVVLNAVTIHDADTKSCAEITAELRRAKHSQAVPAPRAGLARVVPRLPGPVRRMASGLPAPCPRSRRRLAPPWGSRRSGCSAAA